MYICTKYEGGIQRMTQAGQTCRIDTRQQAQRSMGYMYMYKYTKTRESKGKGKGKGETNF